MKTRWPRLAAILCLVAVFAGCAAPQTNGTPSDAPSTAPASAAPSVASDAPTAPAQETQVVTIVTPVNGPVDADNELVPYLNSLVPGLEVKIEALDMGTYWDLINPRIASGEIPDAMHCHNETMYSNYLDQDVLAGVSPDTIKAHMPKFVAAAAEYGPEVWSVVLSGGLVYGLPAMDTAQTHPFTNAWRGDWLKAVGIEKVPETVEEYEEALKRFTENDPDGNGVKDTYGTTMRGKDSTPNLFPSLFGAYGAYPSMWNRQADGTLAYGIADPRTKEALVTLNRWFEAGYIDPEFTAVDGAVRTEKWANGVIGMMSDSTYYEINPGRPGYENLKAIHPEAEIVRGPAPVGPEGHSGYINWSKITNKLVFCKPILDDAGKIEKLLDLWEIINTDPDVYNRVKFGVEGENWERIEDGSIANIAPYNDMAKRGPLGINAFDVACVVPIPSVQAQTMATDQAEQYKFAEQGDMVNGRDYYSYLSKFADSSVDTSYMLEADTMYKKNIIDFITGERSLDEYDAFVQEWMAAGGAAMTESYNQVLENMQTRMDEATSLFGK